MILVSTQYTPHAPVPVGPWKQRGQKANSLMPSGNYSKALPYFKQRKYDGRIMIARTRARSLLRIACSFDIDIFFSTVVYMFG